MRCVLRITGLGESIAQKQFDKHGIPSSAMRRMLEDVNFDLGDHAEEKLKPCGNRTERQYTLVYDEFSATLWFRFEFDSDKKQLVILDFNIRPFRP